MRTKFKKWAVDYLDESFTNQIKLDDFNKEDFLKVNFDYDNKNISNENALNADFTIDDIDIFKGFELGIKKNENLFNSFNMDYF